MSEKIGVKNRDFWARTYLHYKREIFPKVNDIRGTTRLKNLLEKLAKKDIEKVSEDSERIDDLDWQNLIILDGCRQDTYEEVTGVEDYRISAGSMSMDFIEENFSQGDWSDVIYITANPFFHPSKFRDLTGREVEEVFHSVFHTYKDKWDEEKNTVLPDSVVSDALTAQKLFPDKRKIIHFMQPHHPFVKANLVDTGFSDILSEEITEEEWDLAMRGELDHEVVEKAYKENLEYVLEYVEELKSELEGRTLVTADHGNYLGENGFYGHPEGRREVPLRKVPLEVIMD